jgi:competence protein ComEC
VPLVTATILAYAAGLLSGFGGAFIWTAAAAALVVWRGARMPRERVALGAVAVAGLATATSARSVESSCFDRLAHAVEWDVTLAADASPGAFVGGRHSCGVTLRFAVERGVAVAGARVRVRGVASKGRGGLVVTNAVIRETQAPSILARWRATIGRGIDEHFGADAPLVRALLIADMQELSPTLRDRFAAAGLSHMLSVSGLHVGLIAIAVLLLAQLAGVARGRADALVVMITAVYVVVIGAPLPAVRAAVMLAAYSLGRAVQRPTSAWAILAVGAMVPLLDPRAVLDVGYQLSVVGMVALVAAGALGRRWSWLSVGGWRGTLRRSFAASTTATLLTAPLIAATFGRISLVAPVSNLAAVPIMGALQPMLFLAAVLLPIPGAAQFVADACHPLIAAIDWIASLAARLPGASLPVIVDQTTTVLACAAAAAFVVAAVSRFPGRALLVGATCMAAAVWRPLLPKRTGQTELHMLDVGQGDAIALHTTSGRWVLFDAGRDWRGGDEGQRDVIPYLAARGGPLVAFVLSHPHSDHVGGAASTLRALTPTWYFDPGYAGGTTPYRASLLEARRTRARWRRVRPGDSLVVDEAVITFLAPDSAWAESQRDPNLASSIARIRVGDVAMLLTGDAETPEERWLLAHQSSLLRADVLKVAHHGSNTSSSAAFLDAVRPRLALVSVGAGNMYHHPSASVMQSLAAHGAVTLRTDLHGTIVVRTDGHAIEVEARGERWTLRR